MRPPSWKSKVLYLEKYMRYLHIVKTKLKLMGLAIKDVYKLYIEFSLFCKLF